mmetsp:Transcript_81721/g.165462  ORF Transcript_81721/g.165462 Transcript_81721/m.165462 type:complete len:224 (+) Transcript_81721:1-672(+)
MELVKFAGLRPALNPCEGCRSVDGLESRRQHLRYRLQGRRLLIVLCRGRWRPSILRRLQLAAHPQRPQEVSLLAVLAPLYALLTPLLAPLRLAFALDFLYLLLRRPQVLEETVHVKVIVGNLQSLRPLPEGLVLLIRQKTSLQERHQVRFPHERPPDERELLPPVPDLPVPLLSPHRLVLSLDTWVGHLEINLLLIEKRPPPIRGLHSQRLARMGPDVLAQRL